MAAHVHEAWGWQEHHPLVTFPLLSDWNCPMGIEVSNEELTWNGCVRQEFLKSWKIREASLQFCFRIAGMVLCCILEPGKTFLFQTQVPLYFSRSLFSLSSFLYMRLCSGYGTTFFFFFFLLTATKRAKVVSRFQDVVIILLQWESLKIRFSIWRRMFKKTWQNNWICCLTPLLII